MIAPYLSRVHLSLNVTRGFNSTYIIHQLVSDLFGDREDRGFLYRETSVRDRSADVLVLSNSKPLVKPEPRNWGHTTRVETKPYNVLFREGQKLDYEVRINATSVKTSPSGHKKRLDVWDAIFEDDPGEDVHQSDVYGAYVTRKLDGAAVLDSCHVMERGMRTAARRRRGIPFVAANLMGSLTVSDPQAFLATMTAGMGRAKAFGCGLLCVSRPGTILPRRHAVGPRD